MVRKEFACQNCEVIVRWPVDWKKGMGPENLDGSNHNCTIDNLENSPQPKGIYAVEHEELEVDDEGGDVMVTDDRRKIAKELEDPTPNKRLAFLKEKELTLNSSWEQIIMTELTKQTHLLREILEEMQKND